MIVKSCLLINVVTDFSPLIAIALHVVDLAPISTLEGVTCGGMAPMALVVVTEQVGGGLSNQVRLTRGQVWDDEACTHSKHPRRDARNAPLRYKGAKR